MKKVIKFTVCAGIVIGIILNDLWLHNGYLQYILYGITAIFAMIGICVSIDYLYNKKNK